MAHGYGAEGANHYDVLMVSASASVEEIRASYRAALLAVHPDKVEQDDGSRLFRVQEAWSVLRDAKSRASYDASQSKLEKNVIVGEEIKLEDMEESRNEKGDMEYWYPCRCSDFFFADARELPNYGSGFQDKSMLRRSILLPCGSCSLHLRVQIC